MNAFLVHAATIRARGIVRRAAPIAAAALVVAFVMLASHVAVAAEPLRVFAGIPPIANLVERVGGDRVAVDTLVPAGQDPHTFAPTPRQAVAVSKASIIFIVGLPFESRLAERIGGHLPDMAIVDVSAGVARRPMEGEACSHPHHHHGHVHGPDCNHGHACADAEGMDPHVWLSPPALKTMAENIARALAQADPPGGATYEANLRALTAEIDAAHRRIASRLAPHRGKVFYVFHPALGYFANAYGLRQRAVEIEGKAPTARQLREIIAQARADRARVLLVQPQFDQRSPRIIAEAIGCPMHDFDPLAADVLKNLDALAAKLAEAL
jgi:zinc transport system substrate-binding protein